MKACRLMSRGRCTVRRYGDYPSRGVCQLCRKSGQDRILGLGDMLRRLLYRPARLLGVRKCGCARRQAMLNRYVPLRRSARG